jgi:hypothetical protein
MTLLKDQIYESWALKKERCKLKALSKENGTKC